jgi:demethylmenaquinone methyltransferase/2-methoxy-6-polyprenyl-1,4-benzoquinol methylase
MPLFDHFDFLAPIYDRAIQLRQPERMARIANLPVKGKLLDAGGGTGRVSQALQGMASSMVVADLSFGMLLQAQSKNGLKSVCTHTEKLPFQDETFERVIMVDAMHHVCNHRETAIELWRVVKPGGRIVIEEPDIRMPVVWLVAIAEKVALMRSHFISPPKIQKLFDYPKARVSFEQEGYNAWVIVDKLP